MSPWAAYYRAAEDSNHGKRETAGSCAKEHQESRVGCKEKTNHSPPAEVDAYRAW